MGRGMRVGRGVGEFIEEEDRVGGGMTLHFITFQI